MKNYIFFYQIAFRINLFASRGRFQNLFPKKQITKYISKLLGLKDWNPNEKWERIGLIKFNIPGTSHFMILNPQYWAQRLSIFAGQYYEFSINKFLRKYLNPGDIYIDIGANIGFHLLNASFLVGNRGKCFAFEANPKVYEILKAHVVLNRIANVNLYNCALYDEDTNLQLKWASNEGGGGNFRPDVVTNEESLADVKAHKFDGLIDIAIDNRGICKIDTEGSEVKIIRGMKEFIKIHKKIIYVIEITPDWYISFGDSYTEIFKILEEAGFIAYDISKDGSLSKFSKVNFNQKNIVFVHKSTIL